MLDKSILDLGSKGRLKLTQNSNGGEVLEGTLSFMVFPEDQLL